METPAGYREIAHTADWELEAWAPDPAGLLEQAARGMYALSGARLQDIPRVKRSFKIEAADPESMLVGFLSELLWLAESERLGFDQYCLSLEGELLHAVLEGALLVSIDKEIKAVTWHRLSVRETKQGLAVNIVFDV